MKSTGKKREENMDKNKKEILNNLLKKLLDQKISKLEKNHKIETKNIIDLSNTSQNLIFSLETLSNNVRKQIYANRQKLINNASKLTKKIKITNKADNIKTLQRQNIPKKISKVKKIKTRSYEKYDTMKIEISSEKGKNPNSKNQKFINKKNNNPIKTERISNEYQQRTKSPFITIKDRESLSKKIYNKRFNQIKKTPKKTKKVEGNISSNKGKENKMEKTLDSNKRSNKAKPQIKTENKSNTKQKNIKVINKFDSLDNFADSEILNNNQVLFIKDNNKKDNKVKDKVDNNTPKIQNELEFKGTIKIDDKLVKDSLLVSNNDKGEKEINIDDLIKGPVFEEIIIDEKILNENKDIKNDKNKKEEKPDKKKLLNSSLAIYNKLKRCKITFLEGQHDFDLIFKDEKITDLDIDSNLTKEPTMTEASEHISLEEKFQTNLDLILEYLDYKDISNLILVNKECFKTVINTFTSKTELSIDILQEEINKLKEKNPQINFQNIKKKQFNFSKNSLRAISLLNSSSGNNILKMTPKELNKKEIILIYSLYFIATGKKSKILTLDDSQKMEFMQNYFKKNINKNNFGKFIEKEIGGKIFEDKEIYSLFKHSKNYLDIISPNYFQKINKDIAIFVFVIKDLLDQLGILSSLMVDTNIEYILLNAKLQANKSILDELNQIEENIN